MKINNFFKDLRAFIKSEPGAGNIINAYEKGLITLDEAVSDISRIYFQTKIDMGREENNEITLRMLQNGYEKGILRLTVDPMSPDGKGTVAQIGDRSPENYFFFGGTMAEDMTPKDYVKSIGVENVVEEIYHVLDKDMKNDGVFEDEYKMYYLVLKEAA